MDKLVPIKHVSFPQEDSLMACLTFHKYRSVSLEKRKHMRHTLLLQFCNNIFTTRHTRIRDVIQHLTTLCVCTTHPTITAWIERYHYKPQHVKRQAMQFIFKNMRVGFCTCHYTLLALYRDVFHCNVWLRESSSKPVVFLSKRLAYVYIEYNGVVFKGLESTARASRVI